MTHLISPWVFYWIDILSGITFASWLLISIISIPLFIIGVHSMVEWDDWNTTTKSSVKKVIKNLIISMIILFGLTIVIPSEKTMYTMLVADQITVENINGLKQTTTELVDYVIEKVDVLLDEQSSDKN